MVNRAALAARHPGLFAITILDSHSGCHSRFTIRYSRFQTGVGMKKLSVLILACVLISVAGLDAQRGRGGGGAPAASPRQAAPFDLSGYWVSPIIEDWKYRMVVPNKGVFDGLPLNAQGREVGNKWDPAADEAAGEQCRGFGAGGIIRDDYSTKISCTHTTKREEPQCGGQT